MRTAPSPEPVVPEMIEIHGARLVAVHAHPAEAATSIAACSPLGAIASRRGDTVYAQFGAGGGGPGDGVKPRPA